MKAKLVKENLNFTEDGDPYAQMRVGKHGKIHVAVSYQPKPISEFFFIGTKLKVLIPYYFRGCDDGFAATKASAIKQNDDDDWQSDKIGDILEIDGIIIDGGEHYSETVIQLDYADYIEENKAGGHHSPCRMLHISEFEYLIQNHQLEIIKN